MEKVGDGATNIGAFHEAINLAVVWKLPVVFICENNLYMEYTPISAVTAVEHPAADRAAAYSLPRIVIDGNDVVTVRDEVSRAVGRARTGEGPSIIQRMTDRHYGHSRTDPAKIGLEGELEQWLMRDPVKVLRERLVAAGVVEAELESIEGRAKAVVDAAIEAAKAAPLSDPSEAFTDVWADGGSTWRS
jgi:pyruvate dehydrogenase E1 component alpha subunit